MDEQSIPAEVPLVGHTVEPVVVRLSDSVTLIHGDCRDVLPIECDAVVTDPPYPGREDLFPTESVWSVLRSIKCPSFIFWPCVPDYPCGVPDAVHIWHKSIPIHPNSEIGNAAGHQYERILAYGLGKKCEVFRVAAIMPNFAACAKELQPHPTQKPLALVERLVEKTKAQTVLDPYMGSGTTGIACIRTGRKFIGIEIDAGHFETARKRMEAELMQGTFDFSGGAAAPTHNAKVSGAGTASAGLPGWQANGETE